MRAIVFINGIIQEYGWLRDLIRDDDYLVCADGGTMHCLACDRTPHVVIGDMDSLDTNTITALRNEGVLFEKHPADKNETDLELAVDKVLTITASQGETGGTIDKILLVGVLGGRLDQMLANLLFLTQRKWPVPLRIVDKDESAQLIRSGETLKIEGRIGDALSALPLSPTVTGITYTGLRYPLENATLQMGSTRAISNEFAHEEATITIASGALLIVHRSVSPRLAD